MHVVSVNVGQPAVLGERRARTGIFKQPVGAAVHVGPLGLAGDHIGNTTHHGGPDQAVYLYSAEDTAWWSGELGRALEPGTFGENLTLSTFGPEPLRIGHRIRTGEVLLELTAPRIPCGTLAARMDDPQFVTRFKTAARPGAYARVLEPGDVRAGDPVIITPPSEPWPPIADLFALWYATPRDPAQLRALLAAPLGERARDAVEGWLAAADRG